MALSAHALTLAATAQGEPGCSGMTLGQAERLINAISEEIEQVCGRHFERDAAVVDKLPGYGGPYLVVTRPPIILPITSIVYNGTLVPTTDYESLGVDAEAGLIYNPSNWAWTAGLQSGVISDTLIPGTERRLYVVTYAGGYQTPAQGGTRTLPYDLEEACIQAVVTAYRELGENLRIRSEGLLSARTEYGERSSLPTSVLEKLRPYIRRIAT